MPDEGYETMRRLVEAINRIDGSYYFFARSLGVKDNALALLYALDDGRAHLQARISEEWLIPKTTVNTIVKEMARAGYVRLEAGEDAREKALCLTEQGQAYASDVLGTVYEAERQALCETLQAYSPEFVEALDYFSQRLHEAYLRRFRPAHEKERTRPPEE